MILKIIIPCLLSFFQITNLFSQNTTIKEELLTMKTYMFSDPDPVPNISRIYPYFRFDGYATTGKDRDWKMVVLENEYIKVYVCPDVGGKIWGAFEKSTGKEFLYFNEVVKFRDVAMRGAWSSGGLEYNFGDIGHVPTCSTPVDYVIKENEDGSVSCIVGAIDLPSRTKWNVEISLQKDKAYFETKVSWFNTSSLPVSYYHWMNAAAKADGNLEFIYPGNKHIGHGGELGEWPIDNNRDISKYKNNDFGIYKSYHVINSYSDIFGGYWHDDDFGFGHYASYDDKPGKKLWIWGLSDQGMIWEDLLTDSNGQYIEYQAGKLFNQAANSSTLTPFKHKEFSPYDTDIMHELWFPLKETNGMVAASEYGVLNIERKGNKIDLFLSPLQPINSELIVKVDDEILFTKKINRETLELYTDSFSIENAKYFSVELGNKLLVYNSQKKDNIVNRPVTSEKNFNWSSAYGLYIQGLELEKQRRYTDAQLSYLKSYKKESSFLPTLNKLALNYYRSGNQEKALEFVNKSLRIDTYNGLANYIFGLVNAKLENSNEAKSGFSIASQDVSLRSASYTELAKLFLKEQDLQLAKKYTDKALSYNVFNIKAVEIKAIIHRKENNREEAIGVLSKIDKMDATSHFINFEKYLHGKIDLNTFNLQITNELPFESYLELASKYIEYGCEIEALKVLEIAPKNVMVSLWKAYLNKEDEDVLLQESLAMTPEMVFPHRQETAHMLNYFILKNSDWKLKYYLGIQQWNKGNIEAAQSLFQQCEDKPNTILFYLAKIKLFNFDDEITLKSLNKSDEINADDWRLKLAWIEYFDRTNQLEFAKKLAGETIKIHPEKAIIGLFYAKTLLKLKAYKTCFNFLENFEVLPFEGATEGRTIYHEACIRLSLKELTNKNYSKAIHYAQKAKIWPKNLGVGKHYDVDDRLDNYLIALAFEKLGKKEESDSYYNKIIEHKTPNYLNESSKLYIQLEVLRKFDNDKLLVELSNKYSSKSRENKYIEWAFAKFANDNEEALRKNILNSKTDLQVYDTKFIDVEFKLVTEILQ